MKKLILFIFMFMFITGVQSVSADSPDTEIVFTCNNVFDDDAIEGVLFFGASATEVTISLPENVNTLLDNGSHILKIWFYDDTDALVSSFNVDEVFGPEFEGAYTYYINFFTLGIDTDAVYLKYTIPMAVGDPCDVDTLAYYTGNTTTSIGFTHLEYGSFGWVFLENTATSLPDDVYSYDWLQSSKVEIPADTKYINLGKGNHSIHTQYMLWYSTIDFYDDVDVLIDSYNLIDFVPERDYTHEAIDIDITLLTDYLTFDTFRINEVWTVITPDIILLNNALFTYNFDNAVTPIVNFWVDDVIDFDRLVPIGSYASYSGGFPSLAGSNFVDWVYHDNTPYRYPDALNGDYLINGSIDLYAIFRVIPTDLVGDVVDFVPDEESNFTVALTSLGFNDPIERTIVFGFVVIISALLLLFKGVSNIAILIVVTCELLFFMYLGVIPLFASIIVGLILLLIGFKTMSGGGTNE